MMKKTREKNMHINRTPSHSYAVCGPIDRGAIDGSVLSTRLLVVVPCNYQTLPPPPIDRTVNTRQPMLPHHRCVTTNAK